MKAVNRWIQKIDKKAFIAIWLTSLICWVFSYLAINVFRDYAWGLFIWLPFVLGATSTLLYHYNNPAKRRREFRISVWALLVFCMGLLVFAWEGIVCMIMVLPIGMFFTWLGHLLAYKITKGKVGNTPATVIFLFISVPALMAFENTSEDKEEVRAVITSIEINASPEQVWNNVIAFPELEEPEEFIFKTGIAYPVNATIHGQGVGAVRHCNFSTGSFVEPITVWDEPRLLKFSVEEQPEPMKELSFYDIHPNHLHGYWVSKQGQFKLTKLSNGHTLLEGTTWYINKIRPGIYWTIWSDYIVHQIHGRVLRLIKIQSENRAAAL